MVSLPDLPAENMKTGDEFDVWSGIGRPCLYLVKRVRDNRLGILPYRLVSLFAIEILVLETFEGASGAAVPVPRASYGNLQSWSTLPASHQKGNRTNYSSLQRLDLLERHLNPRLAGQFALKLGPHGGGHVQIVDSKRSTYCHV